MYGVLYAVTTELFPTKDRGTGNGIVATANRIFGVMVSLPTYSVLYISCTYVCPAFFEGTDYCLVRRPYHVGTHLDLWHIVPCCRANSAAAAV